MCAQKSRKYSLRGEYKVWDTQSCKRILLTWSWWMSKESISTVRGIHLSFRHLWYIFWSLPSLLGQWNGHLQSIFHPSFADSYIRMSWSTPYKAYFSPQKKRCLGDCLRCRHLHYSQIRWITSSTPRVLLVLYDFLSLTKKKRITLISENPLSFPTVDTWEIFQCRF